MSANMKPAPTGSDKLLVEIGKSIMPKAIVISIVAHVVLTILTSFSLFADWASDPDYRFRAPATINQKKAQKAREAEELKRKQDAEEKAKKAAAEAAAAAKTNKVEKAAANVKDAGKTVESSAAKAADAKAPAQAKAEDGKVTPPEVQPLPPKASFEYGDDLSLD